MEAKMEDIKVLNPACLAPADTMAKASTVGKGKSNMALGRLIPLSMLAGMYIGSGALFMLFVKADANLTFAVSQVLGGLCFSLGLICVIVCGAELFTGNCLMVIGVHEHEYSWGALIKSWVLVWIFNFVGSLLLVFIVFFANSAGMNSGGVGNAMITTAATKISLPWVTAFFRGIGCNFLVCLAVWMGFTGKTVIDKVFTTIFPVMAFVAMGMEHCVANMFFLPMGVLLNASGFAYTGAADTSVLTVGGIFYNLSASTLGNIVGGAVLVGLMYWLSYHKKKAAA